MTPASVLAFLEKHATYILIQHLPPTRRQKNRCLLEYRDAGGNTAAVGGRNLFDAVSRAALRMSFAKTTTSRTEVEMPIPAPETSCIASETTSEGVTAHA